MGCVFGKESSLEERREEVREAKVDVVVGVGVGGRGREVENVKEGGEEKRIRPSGERRRRSSKPNPRLSNPSNNVHGEQVAAGWPSWLSKVAGEAINGLVPRRADTFEKLDKVKEISDSGFLLLFPKFKF
jgi:cyclin-dependent kinase 12/13